MHSLRSITDMLHPAHDEHIDGDDYSEEDLQHGHEHNDLDNCKPPALFAGRRSLIPRQYTSSTTVYAACATNNFVDTVASGPEGAGIGGIALQGGGAFTDDVTAVVNSAYNCCVFGLGVPFAAAVFAWDETTGNCFVAGNSNTCPAGGQNNNFAQVQTQSSVQYVAGNLPCGAITEAD